MGHLSDAVAFSYRIYFLWAGRVSSPLQFFENAISAITHTHTQKAAVTTAPWYFWVRKRRKEDAAVCRPGLKIVQLCGRIDDGWFYSWLSVQLPGRQSGTYVRAEIAKEYFGEHVILIVGLFPTYFLCQFLNRKLNSLHNDTFPFQRKRKRS